MSDADEVRLGMDAEEERIATMFYNGMQAMSGTSDRSKQAGEFKVGVSDLGFCSERVRRMLLEQVPEETDLLLAWLGTAIGDHAEQAAMLVWPDAIRQASVTVPLQGSQQTYHIPGHPDLIVPSEKLLIDVKSDYGLSTIERTGASRQQRFQRHGYALGAWHEGYFGDIPLEEVRVANVWIDRAGIDKRLHCEIEPYDPEVVLEMAEWLDEVVYNYVISKTEGESEAPKEPPREMCAVVCGFYNTCRAFDTDAEGLLTGHEVLTAVDMYLEGFEAEKAGRKLKDEAKQHLQGISGSTGENTVRWTWVNETEVPASRRRGYNRLDIRPIRQKGKS